MTKEQLSNEKTLKRLIEVGIALSAIKDRARLMQTILQEAKQIARADGGSLYRRTEEDVLAFEILLNDSLGLAEGGAGGPAVSLPPVALYGEDGSPNWRHLASHAALAGKTLNIADAYARAPAASASDHEAPAASASDHHKAPAASASDWKEYDLAGTRAFDKRTGYRTQSVLAVPLKNAKGRVIGVLQLLNAQDSQGRVIPFPAEIQPLVEALASQAAVALDNALLIEAQERLLDAIIALVAQAVDAKSPYTGRHCERVPALVKMLAQAACDATQGPFARFALSAEEWRELHVAAWLHDCGKVTTPEHIVDKATKLETISNRIHEIRMRFEVAKREAVIACLEKQLAGEGSPRDLQAALKADLAQLDDDFRFIAECNLGSEAMTDAQIARVQQIAKRCWTRTLDDSLGLAPHELARKRPASTPASEPLLADREEHLIPFEASPPASAQGFRMTVPAHKRNLGEIHNLCVRRGTLTEEERFAINDHIVQTIVMLESLPFPPSLRRVPEIAGGHHERMDGAGYPRRLKGADMPALARMMAIADVFEALTAADRPYKPPKTLAETLAIMSQMAATGHLDPQLYQLFTESGIPQTYAARHLNDG